MRGWCATSAMRGVQMQLEQSSVGKTLFRPTMTPPMEGCRSTSSTSKPWLARSSAACIPAIPPPITSPSYRSLSLVAMASSEDTVHGSRFTVPLAPPERGEGEGRSPSAALGQDAAVCRAQPHDQRHLTGQAVGRAAEAGVVGAEGHLDHVQQPLGHLDAL